MTTSNLKINKYRNQNWWIPGTRMLS